MSSPLKGGDPERAPELTSQPAAPVNVYINNADTSSDSSRRQFPRRRKGGGGGDGDDDDGDGDRPGSEDPSKRRGLERASLMHRPARNILVGYVRRAPDSLIQRQNFVHGTIDSSAKKVHLTRTVRGWSNRVRCSIRWLWLR